MKPSHILVVDDSEEVRDIIFGALEDMGHEVEVAEDGSSALSLLSEKIFDLVLTDLQMPNMNGIQLLKAIKSIDQSIPVIMITGFPTLDNAIEAMKLGATDFVTKPFKLDYFELIVKRAIDEHTLLLENTRLLAEVNKKTVIETLNKKLHQKLGEVSNLYRMSSELDILDDNDSLFRKVVDICSELTGAKKVSLMLLDKQSNNLILRESIGFDPELAKKIIIPVGQGIAGKVALDKEPIFYNSKNSKDLANSNPDRQYKNKSYISVPLIIAGEAVGVINVTDKIDDGIFKEEDFSLITSIAQKATIKMENNALYEGIYSNLVDTMKSLVTSIEAKDPYTKEHSQRVTSYSVSMARCLGCSEEEVEELQFSGFIHDIGKIGIKDHILLKESRLTDEEYKEIQQHPVIGDNIVKPLGLMQSERDIIRHHHERFDGKGYPDQLKGEEIHYLARILTVADSFDAMTSTRPYRAAMSIEFALAEVIRNSGTQFDPEIVEALKHCIEKGIITIAAA